MIDEIKEILEELFKWIYEMMSDVRRPFKPEIVAATCLTIILLIYFGIFCLILWITWRLWSLLEFWVMVEGVIGFCWIMFMLLAVARRRGCRKITERLKKVKKEEK